MKHGTYLRLIAIALAMACRGDGATEPAPEPVLGTWIAVSVEGATLHVRAFDGDHPHTGSVIVRYRSPSSTGSRCTIALPANGGLVCVTTYNWGAYSDLGQFDLGTDGNLAIDVARFLSPGRLTQWTACLVPGDLCEVTPRVE